MTHYSPSSATPPGTSRKRFRHSEKTSTSSCRSGHQMALMSKDASPNASMPRSDMGAPPSTWSIICIFNLFTMKASEGFYVQIGEIIFKPGPVVPKGSDVLVMCTLTNDPCNKRGSFVIDIDRNSRKPDWMNQTFSSMLLPNVRRQLSVVCYLRCGMRSIIDTADLYVGSPPDQPSNISCSLGELSSEMTCTWDTGQETELNTVYDVRIVNLQTGKQHVEKRQYSSVQITVNPTQDTMFHIQITARNPLNYSVSDVVPVRLSDIVIPITPIIRKIQLLQSTFIISISWRNQTLERRSYCEVQYKTPTDPSWKTIGEEVNINSSIVINKTAIADSLRVRCREEIGNSYWSNWSSPVQVPPSAPEGAPNVWRVLGPDYPNGTQEVTILITMDNDELPQRTISGYKVFYRDKENMMTLRTCAPSEVHCITLVPEGVKMVFVSAFNSYGTSPESNVPIQEDSDLPQPPNLTSTSSWPIQVQWQSPHSSGRSLLWYILQWNPDTCDGRHRSVSWRKLLKDKMHFSLNDITSDEQRVTILLYAVYSSGVSRPSMVEFKPESGPEAITMEISQNKLFIQWSEVPVCKRRGFITTYTLYVKEEPSGVQYEYNSETRHFTFMKYSPDQRYSVCISASTKAGEGPSVASCAIFEPDKSSQDYFGPLLGTCLGAITLTALILALSMIQKRIKSALRLLLPKYLCEEYPNVANSIAVTFLQEKKEDSQFFLNPSYSDPEITDVQEALQLKIATIIRETPETHPLLKTATDDNMLEPSAKVDPHKPSKDDNMVEHMAEVGPPHQITADNMTEHTSGYRPTDNNMVEHMAKVGPPHQTMADIMTEHLSDYRPQATQPNLQSPDAYCSPFHLLDIQREALSLESPVDGSNRNDTFQMDFSLFQGMDLQVLNDGAPENGSASLQAMASMTAWSERQGCNTITEMVDNLSSQLICHLPLGHGKLQDTNPYFPQIFARGT